MPVAYIFALLDTAISSDIFILNVHLMNPGAEVHTILGLRKLEIFGWSAT